MVLIYWNICVKTGKNARKIVLEHSLLSEARLDYIFPVENLKQLAYKAKRFYDS